ncbi:MAG TPA: hypothetical protein VHG35_02590 [Gemmatimonadales bacterium]|nr:hypothetical protein [Gemmatimonadales bacterium]
MLFDLKLLWMYFLRSFQEDPTTGWPVVGPMPLVLDIARAEINGVPLDGSYMQLRQFGRPSNPRPYRARQLAFAPLGLEVNLYPDDRICNLTAIFHCPAGSVTDVEFSPDFVPCAIELRLDGNAPVQVTSQTTRADLMSFLGEPQEETSAASTLGYLYPKVHLNFEFDSQGQLLLLDVEWLSPAA